MLEDLDKSAKEDEKSKKSKSSPNKQKEIL